MKIPRTVRMEDQAFDDWVHELLDWIERLPDRHRHALIATFAMIWQDEIQNDPRALRLDKVIHRHVMNSKSEVN